MIITTKFFVKFIETLLCYGALKNARKVHKWFVMNTTQIISTILLCFGTQKGQQKVHECFEMNITYFFIKVIKV